VTHAGLREDFVDTLSALTARELSMEDSRLYFGGLPPDFAYGDAFAGLASVGSLLGSMRAITTSNPGSNSLLNPLYTEQVLKCACALSPHPIPAPTASSILSTQNR
jgi:hypothetical protein